MNYSNTMNPILPEIQFSPGSLAKYLVLVNVNSYSMLSLLIYDTNGTGKVLDSKVK